MDALRRFAAAAAVGASGLCLANRIDIVSEAQAPRLWQPDPAARQYVAGYPESASDKSRDVCVDIGYLIKLDGSTSNYTEVKSWSGTGADAGGTLAQSDAEPYVQVAAAVVSHWHFVPVGKPHSIYTAATFAFDGDHKLAEEAIRGHCRIDDLAGFVASAKTRSDLRGDLNHARADRLRQDDSMVERMGNGQY